MYLCVHEKNVTRRLCKAAVDKTWQPCQCSPTGAHKGCKGPLRHHEPYHIPVEPDIRNPKNELMSCFIRKNAAHRTGSTCMWMTLTEVPRMLEDILQPFINPRLVLTVIAVAWYFEKPSMHKVQNIVFGQVSRPLNLVLYFLDAGSGTLDST